MTEGTQERDAAGASTPERQLASEDGAEEVRRVYLRTTRALNPGLPHTVDFPDLWG